jgi:hypothetical protein
MLISMPVVASVMFPRHFFALTFTFTGRGYGRAAGECSDRDEFEEAVDAVRDFSCLLGPRAPLAFGYSQGWSSARQREQDGSSPEHCAEVKPGQKQEGKQQTFVFLLLHLLQAFAVSTKAGMLWGAVGDAHGGVEAGYTRW